MAGGENAQGMEKARISTKDILRQKPRHRHFPASMPDTGMAVAVRRAEVPVQGPASHPLNVPQERTVQSHFRPQGGDAFSGVASVPSSFTAGSPEIT